MIGHTGISSPVPRLSRQQLNGLVMENGMLSLSPDHLISSIIFIPVHAYCTTDDSGEYTDTQWSATVKNVKHGTALACVLYKAVKL